MIRSALRFAAPLAALLGMGWSAASEAGDLARAMVKAKLLAPPSTAFKVADGPLTGVQDFKTPEAVFGGQYSAKEMNPFWVKSTSRASAQFFYYHGDQVALAGVNVLFYPDEATARAALADPDFFPASVHYVKLQRGRALISFVDDSHRRKAQFAAFLKTHMGQSHP